MLSLSFEAFQLRTQNGEPFLLLDVREAFEHETFNIGGINIPLGTLSAELDRLPADTDIIIYCAKGIRSAIAVQKLESKGYRKVYNLSGGISFLSQVPSKE